MNASGFVDRLATWHFANVFNPYSDICPQCDRADAPRIRRRNLQLVLEAAIAGGVDSVWVARDLGYRGGRRTGLALTDEAHLSQHARLLATPSLVRATQDAIVAERTAKIVWQALQAIDRRIFLWNAFPLHPHNPAEPLSNRCHTKAERRALQPLNTWLLETLRPEKIVAIGRDAHQAMQELGVASTRIRHPSYGGRTEFLAGLAQLYSSAIQP